MNFEMERVSLIIQVANIIKKIPTKGKWWWNIYHRSLFRSINLGKNTSISKSSRKLSHLKFSVPTHPFKGLRVPPDSTDLHPVVEELVAFVYIYVDIGLLFFVFSLSQIIFHCLHTGILFLYLIASWSTNIWIELKYLLNILLNS